MVVADPMERQGAFARDVRPGYFGLEELDRAVFIEAVSRERVNFVREPD